MKKWIIIGFVVVISLLAFRAYRNFVDGTTAERRSYVRELNFDFSGIVDTVSRSGHILFHATEPMDRGRERTLNAELHYNGVVELFNYKDGKLELMMAGANQCQRGDSVYINSEQNVVKVFRGKTLIVRNDLINSIKGRPF